VLGVCEESLTVSSIRRLKGGRKRRLRPPFDLPHRTIMNGMSPKFSLMITSVALAAILAGVWLAEVFREHDSRAMLLPDQVITLFPDPKPLTAFALTDHKNRVFDLASLKGKWSFLFFGFTHCPDVCPTTLAVLARVRASIAN
jgi:cytochrome oxidase Cu insertion factor (SCO1/SenC/PrrC family)